MFAEHPHYALCIMHYELVNDFRRCAVGVADYVDLAAGGLVEAYALKIVIAFNFFRRRINFYTFHAAHVLNVEVFPNICGLISVERFVPNIKFAIIYVNTIKNIAGYSLRS